MTFSQYDSDLELNTYYDVIFYLFAGLAILYEGWGWIVPTVILAALNRETSGLIPVMLFADQLKFRPRLSLPRKPAGIAAIAMTLYAAVFVGLKLIYGPRKLQVPYGHQPGLNLLWFNVSRPVSWQYMFGVMSVLPVLALLTSRRWPRSLQRICLAIVPAWFMIHLFLSNAQWAESRYFLVPQVMVFIPGALLGLVSEGFSGHQIPDTPPDEGHGGRLGSITDIGH
jgi:hypothetical protein